MNKARALYEKNKLELAIDLYSKVKSDSDFWLESLEEKAWAKTRLGKHEEALADLKSIASPVWSAQVGPETYMLSTFVSLKICAYKDVLKKISTFKKIILPRVDALEKIQEEPLNETHWSVLNKLKDANLTMISLGKLTDQFPRYFFRDKELISSVKAGQMSQAQSRLRQLAAIDLEEIKTNLKKMKVIEVELIQNVMTLDENTKTKKEKLKFEKVDANKSITFPISNEEVWLDEVGHYQVKAQKCPYYTEVKKL
ncbi:MAG: hypothetical protein AABY64_03150 [Bdellovibrionota bacterium]